jgi:hypothetical protein
MAKKPIEVKKTNEVKEPKKVKETIEVKEPKEVKKTKVKRLPKGQRKHIRRMKQAERKEAIIVNPKN